MKQFVVRVCTIVLISFVIVILCFKAVETTKRQREVAESFVLATDPPSAPQERAASTLQYHMFQHSRPIQFV